MNLLFWQYRILQYLLIDTVYVVCASSYIVYDILQALSSACQIHQALFYWLLGVCAYSTQADVDKGLINDYEP